ncbi:MAG: molecular chaperone [Candidatus Omnitrophica bacterium]|nr:molecular chaperone [Candidatus Omnitrophota bacterium]
MTMTRLMKVFLAAFFLFSLNLLGENAYAQSSDGAFSLAVGPTNVRLKGQTGETRNATVRIWNQGSIKVRVQSELNDIQNILDKDGKLERQFLPPGTTDFSCAKWIILDAPEFDLEPNSFKDVNFTVSLPADQTGSRGAALFFRGVPAENPAADDSDGKPKTSVQLQPRLGVLVFFDVEGTVNRQGELKTLTWEPPAQDKPLIIRYAFENQGNADILLTGNFLIMDSQQALIAKGDLNPIRTFPGDHGVAETAWPGLLEPGKYELIVTFELGPDAAQVIVKTIDLVIE